MIYLFLDILIYNFTKYNSYFFLAGLYNKRFIYYFTFGLIIDLIILNTPLYNTITLTIIYVINNIFKRYNVYNIYIYLLNLLLDYIIFIILTNFIMNCNYKYILINIGTNLIINLIFYFLSYKSIIKEYN